MKNLQFFPHASIAAALVAGVVVGGLALAPGAKSAANEKHLFLVIDQHEVMLQSKLGQNIHRQIMAYVDKMQSDLGAQGQDLQSQIQALQQQPASPDRDKKMQALQAKQAAYRQKVQARQLLIQGGEMAARQHYMADLGGIVEAIMQEQGAQAVLVKSAIVASVGGLDITKEVIARLDRKDSNFKVPLVNPPPSATVPMQ